MLEHLVDTVIYFEDGASQLRALRAVKNRFGSTGEMGFFEMTEKGLEEVPDASTRLLSERVPNASGTTVLSGMEGSRPLLAGYKRLSGTLLLPPWTYCTWNGQKRECKCCSLFLNLNRLPTLR